MEYLISIFLGSVASAIQGKIKIWPKWAKYLLSFGSCLVVSLIVQGLKIQQAGTWSAFEWDMFLSQIGIAFTASQTFYNVYFKEILTKTNV